MTRLNQVIAVLPTKKTQAEKSLTEAHHRLQKESLLSGIRRTYRPKDEEGETLPPKEKLVQATVVDEIEAVRLPLIDWFDVVATQEYANTKARADVVTDEGVLLGSVPVSVLLFLEKRLTDLRTFISKLPILSVGERWESSTANGIYQTSRKETTRTKKVPRNHVLAEATKEHPALVRMYTEDVIVGFWDTVELAGAIPVKKKQEMLRRVQGLLEAVKKAREEANSIEVKDQQIGSAILDFVFGP